MKTKIPRYSQAFKRQVVSEYEAGASCRHLQQKYGIGGSDTINRWVRQFSRQGLRQELMRIQRPDERDQIKLAQERIQRLEQAVSQLALDKILLQAELAEPKPCSVARSKQRSAADHEARHG